MNEARMSGSFFVNSNLTYLLIYVLHLTQGGRLMIIEIKQNLDKLHNDYLLYF